MPQIHDLKANKAYKCEKCGKAIAKGGRYLKYSTRSGPYAKGITHKRHPECRPRASELTSSEYLGAVYAAEESFSDAVAEAGCLDDIIAAIDDAKGALEEARSTCEDKKSNLEEAFSGGCPAIDLMDERIEACESAESELESAADEVEALRDDYDAAEAREADASDKPEDEETDDRSADDILQEARDACDAISWPS